MSGAGDASQSPRPDRLLAIRNSIARGERSVRDVVTLAIERMTSGNERTNALTQILADEAMVRAAELDAARSSLGPAATLPPLFGVPMIIKDNICTRLGLGARGAM